MRPNLTIAAVLATAAGAAVLLVPAASAGQPDVRIPLNWNEVAPLCNRLSTVGVTGCAGTHYPAAFRVRVSSLTVTGGAWAVSLSVTNLTRSALTVRGGPVELCLFPSPTSARARCLTPPLVPGPLVTIRTGGTWRTTARGTGTIAAGQWIRFLLPTVRGAFASPTGGVIAWMTVHAYRFGPNGHSVASAIGTG